MHIDIADELIRRFEIDQTMRKKSVDNEAQFDTRIDIENTEFMKTVIENIGWPSISKVGERASYCGWLLVQHADKSPDFQKKCLKLMKSLPDGDIDISNIAYLEDRVLVADKKPQIYGTQFYKDGDVWKPNKIEDIANLDSRRQAMGLMPFKEYEKIINSRL